jgi:hypothetical protein
MAMPSCRPTLASAWSGRWQLLEQLLHPLQGRDPATLRTTLPAAAVTVIGGPDRTAALADEHLRAGALQQHADRPALAPAGRRAAGRVEPVPARAGRHRTDHREARQHALAWARKPSTGKLYGSGSSTTTASASSSGVSSGMPTTAVPASVRSTSRWNERSRTSGSTAASTLTAARPSTPAPPPITPLAVQPSAKAAGSELGGALQGRPGRLPGRSR